MEVVLVLTATLFLAGFSCAAHAPPASIATLRGADPVPAGRPAVILGGGAGFTAVGWPAGGMAGSGELAFGLSSHVDVGVSGYAMTLGDGGYAQAARTGARWANGEAAVFAGVGLALARKRAPSGAETDADVNVEARSVDFGASANVGESSYASLRISVASPVKPAECDERTARHVCGTPTTTYATGAIGLGRASPVRFEIGLAMIFGPDNNGWGGYFAFGFELTKIRRDRNRRSSRIEDPECDGWLRAVRAERDHRRRFELVKRMPPRCHSLAR